MGSLTTGHRLTASQGFHSQVHNEKHFVRTMQGFKHITQTSLKRKLDLRVEMRCERGEDL